jgi:FMN-dependent dehydrogenase
MSADPLPPINLDNYQEAARARLPRDVYDYVAGGAGDEVTLRDNRSAFDRRRPRAWTYTPSGRAFHPGAWNHQSRTHASSASGTWRRTHATRSARRSHHTAHPTRAHRRCSSTSARSSSTSSIHSRARSSQYHPLNPSVIHSISA